MRDVILVTGARGYEAVCPGNQDAYEFLLKLFSSIPRGTMQVNVCWEAKGEKAE